MNLNNIEGLNNDEVIQLYNDIAVTQNNELISGCCQGYNSRGFCWCSGYSMSVNYTGGANCNSCNCYYQVAYGHANYCDKHGMRLVNCANGCYR